MFDAVQISEQYCCPLIDCIGQCQLRDSLVEMSDKRKAHTEGRKSRLDLGDDF